MKSLVAIILCLFAFAGCSAPPRTDAVCVSQCLDTWNNLRVLIWTNEPRIEALLVDWVRSQGGQVIDSMIVGDVANEQDPAARSAQADDHQLRRMGLNVGADRVLAATVERRSYPLYNLYSGYKEGHPRVTTLFDPTVTIRSINVSDESIQWRVTAKGGSTSFVYDSSVTELARTALERAACEANVDTRWTDERGCIDKSQA
ncbi:MAG TPA: hypothetical protein VFM24_07495 [Nitrospira sp.]|nr:hypothetical protein [Nitrospira sp.]